MATILRLSHSSKEVWKSNFLQYGQMKSRDGKSQSRKSEEKVKEEKRRKKIKEEKVRSKKIQVRQKVGKSRDTMFFQCVVAPEGRKVSFLKQRARSHVASYSKT